MLKENSKTTNLTPGLYLVPTPIGNLADLTDRARQILSQSNRILAEDTRRTQKLLQYIGIKKSLISCHEYNEKRRIQSVILAIKNGEALSLVSDSGMPTLSDPGFPLVRSLIAEGIHVEALPGASVVPTALAVSGLPTDRFIFEGFFPRAKGKAKKLAESWKEEKRTIIFFESPYRIAKTLNLLFEILSNRKLVICRELTKLHEEIIRSDLETLSKESKNRQWKGEITVVLEGCGKKKNPNKNFE